MRCPLVILFAIALVLFSTTTNAYCSPGQPCWPTESEIQELYNNLDPSLPRILYWQGGKSPRVSAVPSGSPKDEPLYGLGEHGLKPVYTETKEDKAGTCFDPLFTDYCKVTVRSRPKEGWTPAFTVWPVTADQVQQAVKFAISHNLCIMVAGTGHEFLNRHSCPNGFFIRTSLMKNIEWDFTSTQDAPDGKVKFGVGIVFSEAEKSASDYGRFIGSGRCSTVGIVGWSIGGGRGFFAPGIGLGVDNILEAELVTSDGSFIIANSSQNSDLYWALRGGGGSTWGVITALTLRAHKNPEGGFTALKASWHGTMCGDDEKILYAMIDNYSKVMLSLDKRFGTVTTFSTSHSSSPTCNTTWDINLLSVFQGPPTEPAFQNFEQNLNFVQNSSNIQHVNVLNWYEGYDDTYPLDVIIPTAESLLDSVGGEPSVLVSRDVVASGRFGILLKKKLGVCKMSPGKCGSHMLYHDLTGNIGSPQDENVCISSGFRTALLNWGVYGGGSNATEMEEIYTLGENSYFSESAYEMDGWQDRYWGKNYPHLQQIKQKYDQKGVFWCRHCVELPNAQKVD